MCNAFCVFKNSTDQEALAEYNLLLISTMPGPPCSIYSMSVCLIIRSRFLMKLYTNLDTLFFFEEKSSLGFHQILGSRSSLQTRLKPEYSNCFGYMLQPINHVISLSV